MNGLPARLASIAWIRLRMYEDQVCVNEEGWQPVHVSPLYKRFIAGSCSCAQHLSTSSGITVWILSDLGLEEGWARPCVPKSDEGCWRG